MSENGRVTPPASASKALLAYNALRLLLLGVCLGLSYLAGLRGFALVVVALLVSGVLSWFLLRAQRIRAGIAVEQVVGTSRTGQRVAKPIKTKRAALRARVDAEDAYVDAMLAAQAQPDRTDDHATG